MVYDTTHFKISLGSDPSVSHVFPTRTCTVKREYDRNITIFFSQADCGVTLILHKTHKIQQVQSTNKKIFNLHDC